MFLAQSHRNKFWFGTEERMDWFPTPNRGADFTGQSWGAGGTLLNGGGYQFNSFGSHGHFVFEWPGASSREVAQRMQSYRNGTFGRGLIYFQDPLIFDTNVLPPFWADPSMGIGQEGMSLVYGVDPTPVPTSNSSVNDLPVTSAYYDLSAVDVGWRGKEDAVFIPIPEGYTLALGSFHSQTGTGRVYYREQAKHGALGNIADLVPLANNSDSVVNTFISGANLAGVWLYVGKSGAGAGSVTLTAMIGRLIPSVKTQSTMVAQNLFTNPNLVGDGTWVEVRRNLITTPIVSDSVSQWVFRSGVASPGEAFGNSGRFINIESNPGNGAFLLSFPGVVDAPIAGDSYSMNVSLRNDGEEPITLRLGLWCSGSSTYIHGDDVTIQPGANAALYLLGVIPEGTTSVAPRLLAGPSGIPAVGKLLLWNWSTFEKSTIVGTRFNGTGQDGGNDPDMRYRWTGTPNASESVMEIERVRGFTTGTVACGVSRWEGKPAVRIIPLSPTSNNGLASFIIPEGLREGGTFLATKHQLAPLTGNVRSDRKGILVQSPTAISPDQPNDAGSFPIKFNYPEVTSVYLATLTHGGYQGSGDVWWTDIGLFAGDYDGPAFAGDTGTVAINGKNLRTQWDGAPNNSTSSAWTRTPDFDKLKLGPWIGGQGHSGCRFVGNPTHIKNTGVDGGQVGFAATFREVGHWVHG